MTPTLGEIVLRVESLAPAKRKGAAQGRKPVYSDGLIIALAVYRKPAGFRYARQMPAVPASLRCTGAARPEGDRPRAPGYRRLQPFVSAKPHSYSRSSRPSNGFVRRYRPSDNISTR